MAAAMSAFFVLRIGSRASIGAAISAFLVLRIGSRTSIGAATSAFLTLRIGSRTSIGAATSAFLTLRIGSRTPRGAAISAFLTLRIGSRTSIGAAISAFLVLRIGSRASARYRSAFHKHKKSERDYIPSGAATSAGEIFAPRASRDSSRMIRQSIDPRHVWGDEKHIPSTAALPARIGAPATRPTSPVTRAN